MSVPGKTATPAQRTERQKAIGEKLRRLIEEALASREPVAAAP